MSNIKTSGSAPEPAANTEAELLFARQQAEIRGGEALIHEMSRAVTQRREKRQPSDEDTGQKQPKDTAEISRATRGFSTDGTISADEIVKWILDMGGEDWETFLKWQPDPQIDLTEQLQKLSHLYLALLESALKYAEGENLAEQIERLDALLAEKLNLVMEENLEQLTSLLEDAGQTTALDSIRCSLYRQTAGRAVSPRAARLLFAQGNAADSKSAGHFPSSSSRAREGMIYQPSGKQNIRFQQAFCTQQNSWKEQIRQRTETISNARKGIGEDTFRQGSAFFCSGQELKRANGIAAHITGIGNLFKNPGITAKNEEITGLLAAVMSIKGQAYARGSAEADSITLSIQNAIEKIINQYLSRKGAAHVYHHTLAAYQQMKNPEKAVEEGLNYAYGQFREKQKDSAYQKSPQYSKDSGFFRALLKNLSPEKEFALGADILQRDWQNFLCAFGSRPHLPYLSGEEKRSPWGILADTKTHGSGAIEAIGKILLGTAVTAILCVLAAVCFQFIS